MTAATITPVEPAQLGARYRGDIDGLRAVSVLLVVAFHAGLTTFAGGYVGVDVFFVISGYLVTGILVRSVVEHGRVSLVDFYARRIRRLLPLSATVLLATLLVGFWSLPPLGRRGLLGDAAAAALYVANWRFAAQATAYSDLEVTDGLLLHYWSLSIEEQFYLVWPLLIVAAAVLARRRERLFIPAVTTILVVVVGASLWASIALTTSLGPESYYLTHARLWEMGLGALLAVGIPRLRPMPGWLAHLMAVLGLVAIGVAAVTYGAETPFPGSLALVPALGAAAVITAGAQHETGIGRVLGTRPLRYLGRLSYAWYLWHWPAIGVAVLLRDRAAPLFTDGLVIAASVAVSLALAAISHRLIENPLRHAGWLRVAARRTFAFGLSLTALPVIAVVALSVLGDTGDRALVGEGSGTTPAEPSAMTPAEASTDEVTVGPPECHVDQRDEQPHLPCVFGDLEGEVAVALIGDSHARHWLPAFDAIARERGWRLLSLTKSACSPIDVPTWNSNLEREYVECARWREAVVDHLADQEDLAAVVVARSAGQQDVVLGDDGERGLEGERLVGTWAEGADRTFDALTAVTDRVIVLRDTESSPVDVPTCLSENRDDPAACALERGDEHDDRPLFQAESEVAGPEVRFVDPRPLVCPGVPCSVVTPDGVIKYRDSHHLTQTFSRRLAPELGARIDEAMSG